MTEEVEKVTTDKLKNPGRQEWGRKLGKMQKEMKLKKLEKIDKEEKPQIRQTSFFKWEYALTGVTILIGIGALYYQKKSYECQLQLQKRQKPETEKKEPRFSDF